MNKGCSLCWRRREDGSEYCTYHLAAQKNLIKAFRDWQEALEVKWMDFLASVVARQESGEWVRDVAHHFLERGEDRS